MRDNKGQFIKGHKPINNGKGEFVKDCIPWNKGITGYKTQPCSEERKKQISQAITGMKRSEETKRRIGEATRGRKHTEEWKRYMSKIQKNQPHKKGYKHTEEAKKNMSLAHKKLGTKPPINRMFGEQNPFWQGGGTNVNRKRLARQSWLRLARKIRKKFQYICQNCTKSPAYQIHHIIPWKIDKNDREENLILLCRSCHRKVECEFLFQGRLFQ